jgi:hypothetical protein
MFLGECNGGINHWRNTGYTSYPILSWTGEICYTTDGLNPDTGRPEDAYIYRIKYTDDNNNAPKPSYPKVHIKKGGVEIAGSPFTMVEIDPGDTTYSDGKLYTYSKSGLSLGTDYTYYFEAYDVWNAPASGDPTNPIDEPDVLDLLLCSINGTTTDGANPIQNVTVSVTKDGAEHDSTTTDGSGNYTFTDLNAGSTYVVAPSMKYWLFTPESTTYIDLDGAKTQDFTGTKDFAANLEDVVVYPNPFKPDMGTNVITFSNLTENAKIQIYTITGNLVFEEKADSIEYKWNLKNRNGNDVASGVYIYYISNDKGEKKIGKITIIK